MHARGTLIYCRALAVEVRYNNRTSCRIIGPVIIDYLLKRGRHDLGSVIIQIHSDIYIRAGWARHVIESWCAGGMFKRGSTVLVEWFEDDSEIMRSNVYRNRHGCDVRVGRVDVHTKISDERFRE